MDLYQLRYFLAVVDYGGFNRAAAKLHIAQPSLSQAIRKLERHLDVLLFHRIGSTAVLTDAGEAIIEPARRVLHAVEVTRGTAISVKDLFLGHVDLATQPSLSLGPLATTISTFNHSHPGVRVNIQAHFSAQSVAGSVSSGRAELGLMASADDASLHPDIESYHLEDHDFIVVLPRGHPLAAKTQVTRDELDGLQFVVGQEGTRMRSLAEDIIASGIRLQIVVEAGHREAILPLVLGGVGAAFMPQPWAHVALRAGAGVVRLDPPVRTHVKLLHRQTELTPAARVFKQTVLESPRTTPLGSE